METLEALGIDYMIVGSQASIYYGEPRFTQDIDIVADLAVTQVARLLERFPLPDFYLSEDAMREAITHGGQFNIIHPASGLEIDIILYKMLYFKEGGSERHLRDIGGMLAVSGGVIDAGCVEGWSQRLGLGEIWAAIRRRAPED